jgi:hypothetical protein
MSCKTRVTVLTMTTNPRTNQRDFTNQHRALMDHIDHHPHLLNTAIYKISERANGLGRYEGLEVNLWGAVGDHNGAVDLAAWAATFDGYESHAFRSRATGALVGHLTSHLGRHLVEVTCDLPADTETVAGEHGYERWTPDQPAEQLPVQHRPGWPSGVSGQTVITHDWPTCVVCSEPLRREAVEVPSGGGFIVREPGPWYCADLSHDQPGRDVVAEAVQASDQYQAVSPDTRVAMLTEIAGVSHQEARELVDQDGDHPTGGA